MKEALRRAIAIRDGINRKTGYADTNITDGVNKLSHDKTIILPQLQIIENPKDSDIVFDDSPFEELEYIAATGSQYIDTGLKSNEFDTFEGDILFTDVSVGSALFGGSNSSSGAADNGKTAILIENSNRFYPSISINGTNGIWVSNQNYRFSANVKYHIKVILKSGEQKLYVNNDLICDGSNIATINPTKNVYFLTINYGGANTGTDRNLKGYCYPCKFLLGETVVRDYILVENKYTKKCGLLDKKFNMFYPSIGSGNFTPGPVISGGD